ncbi:MAG TPA: phosphate/phosphite/phosphonate ABC transporter substrate-binding protein [Burkholderiales bacterium]|nr:phosphate/phosphite/phosphonate ABC transporter substrate-binding protein [Burkholderiales bacterium]
MSNTYRLTYYPWITQSKTPPQLDQYIRLFAGEVEAQLGRLNAGIKIEVLPPIEVPAQIAAITSGACEIALMNPLGYIFARRRNPAVVPSVLALRIVDGKPGPTYFAQIYTRKKTAITEADLGKMKGRSIGFGVAYSTSNFLMPAYELTMMGRQKTDKGLHPLTAFSRVEYYGGHPEVAKAVYEGRVDVGAGHDGVIDDLATQYGYGDAKDCLVRLVRTRPIPSDPIVVSVKNEKDRSVLQECFVAAGKTANGAEALKQFWGNAQGLANTEAKAYDELEQILKELSLSDADVLKPS